LIIYAGVACAEFHDRTVRNVKSQRGCSATKSLRQRGDPAKLPITELTAQLWRRLGFFVSDRRRFKGAESDVTNLHLDKRAGELLAKPGDNDEMLSTRALALWLGLSESWLEIARGKGNGPPFIKLAPRYVRYNRASVRRWLQERERTSTR
jgi:predicted DNA-binding transcriptional regulator AlpA